MSIKMKIMVNIVKCANFAEITMKQLGAPQFVMYTKEPGASREGDTTIIKVSLPPFLCPLWPRYSWPCCFCPYCACGQPRPKVRLWAELWRSSRRELPVREKSILTYWPITGSLTTLSQ